MVSDHVITLLSDLQKHYAEIGEKPLPDWVNTHDYESGSIMNRQIMAINIAKELKQIIDFARQASVEVIPISY